MKGVVVILSFLVLVRGQTTNVRPCIYQSNSATLPLNTYVQGCINPPCRIPQLDYMGVEIFFRSPRLIRSMRTYAHAYLVGPLGISHDLGDDAVTCNYLTNTYCPVMEGEIIRYHMSMFIDSSMAVGTAVTIEFVIRNEADNSAVMCIRLPVRVTRPVSRLTQNNTSVLLAQLNNSTVPAIGVNA